MRSISFSNRRWIALAACCILCAGCSLHHPPAAAPVPAPAAESAAKNMRIAVLPVYNLTGRTVPEKEIQQALIEQVVLAGGQVMTDDDLEQFMTRHRIRYIGGVSTDTAQELKEEAGIDAVLVTTVDRYADVGIPAIEVTARLVPTKRLPPGIVWMEDCSMAGDDNPGILDLGVIGSMPRLQQKAVEQIGASLSRFFSGVQAGQTGRYRKYHPTLAFYSHFLLPVKKYRVAVAPFFNKTETNRVDEIVGLHVVRQLVSAGFDVVDPGVVREKELSSRLIIRQGVSSTDEDVLFNTMDADLIVSGKVLDYSYSTGEAGPGVEFNLMVFLRKNKKVVWTSWSRNHGGDGVFFFDMGRVKTAGALASLMAESAVREMVNLGTVQKPDQAPKSGDIGEKWAVLIQNSFVDE